MASEIGVGFDSFPYRHRLSDVLTWEPLDIVESASIGDAAAAMAERDVGSILIRDESGRHVGILTERDIMRLAARKPDALAAIPVGEVMSRRIVTVPADALVYKALGRMERLGIRHLGVTDADGRIVGVVSLRTILKTRNTAAFALGDAIESAPDGPAIAVARQRVPALAEALLADGAPATTVAAGISASMRDATERAGLLAIEAMKRDGFGPPPAPFALLVLGSAGRGESLLSPDQDNAVVFDGTDKDDVWFADWGKRTSDILHEGGIPYCNGGVMASNELWRGTAEGWRRRIRQWIAKASGPSLLNVDIFFDFAPVLGDAKLAADLRRDAIAAARTDLVFLRNLAQHLGEFRPPLTWDAFGLLNGFRTVDGRVDLKIGGTLPLVTAARVLALRHGIEETSTTGRLRALSERGLVPPGDAETAIEALEMAMRCVLEQQLADIASGRAPSSKIDPTRLGRPRRRRLRHLLGAIDTIQPMVEGALAH